MCLILHLYVVVVFTLAMAQLEREKIPKTLCSPLVPGGILEWITILALSLFNLKQEFKLFFPFTNLKSTGEKLHYKWRMWKGLGVFTSWTFQMACRVLSSDVERFKVGSKALEQGCLEVSQDGPAFGDQSICHSLWHEVVQRLSRQTDIFKKFDYWSKPLLLIFYQKKLFYLPMKSLMWCYLNVAPVNW